MNTFLIDLNRLKDFYLIDENLQDKYILSNIQRAQDFVIKPLLGEDKYNELIQKINDNTFTSLDLRLLDYIEPVIAYYVMGEVFYSTYKLKNDMMTGDDINKFDEVVQISRKYKKDSEHYATILEEFICDNSIVLDENKKSNNVYNQGLYLGKKYKDLNDR